jgi:hypothetical protein
MQIVLPREGRQDIAFSPSFRHIQWFAKRIGTNVLFVRTAILNILNRILNHSIDITL